jgi:hypothetical protein
MSQKSERRAKPEAAQPISRRDFTKGSIAVLGAYTSFAQEPLPPLSEAARALKLEISLSIQSLLEERHILEDDVRRVIEHAEKTGLKLYQPGTQNFLSKLRIREAMFYVEYSTEKESYEIQTAYTHRFKLGEEE